jgi:hypothetical protein
LGCKWAGCKEVFSSFFSVSAVLAEVGIGYVREDVCKAAANGEALV